MATVEDIARRAVSRISSDAGLLLAGQFVAGTYQTFIRMAHMRHLRRDAELTIPARLSTGTITATRGSRTVTPNAAALATWGYKIAGRHFRARAVWYEIEAFDGATVTLRSEFAEDTVTAGSYNIVQRYTSLPVDTRYASGFMHPRFHRPIGWRTSDELDASAPGRAGSIGGPRWVVQASPGLDGENRVEFYPYSENAELIRYIRWAIPHVLDLHDEIPEQVDEEALVEGTLVHLYRWQASKAEREGRMEAAAFNRNESRAQDTHWRIRVVPDAIAAEAVNDDTQFVLDLAGRPESANSDLDYNSAYQHVWLGR